MKNQNDLIFSIVFVVLGLVAFGIAIATQPEPPAVPAPPTVNVSPVQLPATAVVYGNALPAAGGNTGGAAGSPGGGGGRMGAMMPGAASGGFPGGGSYPGGGGMRPGGAMPIGR